MDLPPARADSGDGVSAGPRARRGTLDAVFVDEASHFVGNVLVDAELEHLILRVGALHLLEDAVLADAENLAEPLRDQLARPGDGLFSVAERLVDGIRVEKDRLCRGRDGEDVAARVIDRPARGGDDGAAHLRRLRHYKAFPKGANVNFYERIGDDHLYERTFERGVEDFTYACGTGTGSLVTALTLCGEVSGRGVRVDMTGGRLIIDVEYDEGRVENLYLTGPTNIVCKGELTDEELVL